MIFLNCSSIQSPQMASCIPKIKDTFPCLHCPKWPDLGYSLSPKFPTILPQFLLLQPRFELRFIKRAKHILSPGHSLGCFLIGIFLTQILSLCCALHSHLCSDIIPSVAHLKQPPLPSWCHTFSFTPPFLYLCTAGHYFSLYCYAFVDLHVVQIH